MRIFKKIVLGLIGIAVVLHLSIMGIQAFLTWQNNNKGVKVKNSEKEDLEIEKLKRDLGGYQGTYTLYEWDDKKGYLGVKDFDEVPNASPNGIRIGEGILLFSEETKKHFSQIARDVDEWLENDDHKLSPLRGLSESHNYPYLLRNNCILYGAPGTGKTEFVRELNHLLINRYGEEPQIRQPSNDPNDPNYGINIDPRDRERALKGIKKPCVPIFEIKGADIMSTGKDEPKTYEKLVASIQKAKDEFFKNPDWEGNVGKDSQWPYIVFLEEGDQAKNPLTYNPQAKNNLEELKNFFSTGSESKGLVAKSQDQNSIFVVATNNYDTVDPAMKRWGRLGTSLNFTWNPITIKKYGESTNYRINWLKLRDGRDHYCWKFKDNEDYDLIFKLAEKMNFYNFEKHFVAKTNQILQDWQNWSEKKKEDFARSRLGLESKVWCETCQAEINPESISKREERIKRALEVTNDQKEREKILKEEKEKKLTDCERQHEAKPICNWLLHYLHTFFVFYEKQDLENFDSPEKIQRYNFNEKRLLREKINQLRIDLSEINQDMANTLGRELRRASNNLEKLKTGADEGLKEMSNIRSSLDNIQNAISNLPRRS
jgi:ATPase family associated with various cellular activities (AAA)